MICLSFLQLFLITSTLELIFKYKCKYTFPLSDLQVHDCTQFIGPSFLGRHWKPFDEKRPERSLVYNRYAFTIRLTTQ